MKTSSLILGFCLLFSTCSVYKFKDTSIPANIKTIKLAFIENKARYINPQLSPRLNDRLQQKIVGQTRLTRTTSDDADYVISGWISDYSVSLSGISGQQASSNRLTVGVHLVLKNNKDAEEKPFDISKSFEFPGSKSISQVEATLTDEIVRGISDEIFNRLFSDW